MREFCKWLASTPLSQTLQSHDWLIAGLQTIHILGISVVLSSAVLIDLRLLRIAERDQAPDQVARRFLPSIWLVLPVLLASGGLMIIGEPRRSLLNDTFYLKIGLLMAAIGVTVFLQSSVIRHAGFWNATAGRRTLVKFAAAASLLIWGCVILAGRWIAYTDTDLGG